jgi:hypothetical protein
MQTMTYAKMKAATPAAAAKATDPWTLDAAPVKVYGVEEVVAVLKYCQLLVLHPTRGYSRVLGITSGVGNTGCGGWGDGVDLGNHGWDAGGDVARSQGNRGGRGVRCNINRGVDGGLAGGGRGVGIHWVCGHGHGAGGGPARAVGHLWSAGSDGVNDGGALVFVSSDSGQDTLSRQTYGCAVVGSVGSNNGGHNGSGDQ